MAFHVLTVYAEDYTKIVPKFFLYKTSVEALQNSDFIVIRRKFAINCVQIPAV